MSCYNASKNIAYKIFHKEVHSEKQKVLHASAHTRIKKHENEKTFCVHLKMLHVFVCMHEKLFG